MKETIGTRLQYALGIRRISQTELAVKADVSAPYISMLCSGTKNPSKKLLARICSILHISREWLLTGVGSMDENAESKEIIDIAAITTELLNADSNSLKRIFALTIAMLSDDQLRTIADVIEEYNRQKQKATE